MPHKPNLDFVDLEIAFFPVFNASNDMRATGPSPRIFQRGTIGGAEAYKLILSRDHPATWPYGQFAEELSNAEFDAIIAKYDADPKWSREQF